jgi:hypothetical protein
MQKNYPWFLALLLILSQDLYAQVLKPGFNKREYIETLKINQKTHVKLDKWATDTTVPMPQYYNFVYRSPIVAFDNIWDLWISKTQPVAMIAVQGSIPTQASILVNLYAAMIPAKGTIELDPKTKFDYNLSDNPYAAIHVGWFISMAYLSKTIVQQIDSCYKGGIRDFILTGHSQGGGITFLLTSYLESLKKTGKLPQDIRFKTYCSAGPKPGNLFFAYDYENLTRDGWAYNVVNTADWVPDVPFTVQTVDDFTSVNPFRGAKAIIKKQKFPNNMALKYVYNRLSKPSKRAQRNYQQYLGKMVSKMAKKQLPNLIAPEYYKSNYYVRTGNTVVLYPDKAYFDLYSNSPDNPNIWQHHWPVQYLYLAERLK